MGGRRKQDSENSLTGHRMSPIRNGRGVSERKYNMKKNISKAIYEMDSKAQMQQSIYSALRCLDEWDWDARSDHGKQIKTAMDILRTEASAIGNEVTELQEFINGGTLDLDEALNKPLEYEED